MARRALIIQPDYDLLAGFENSAACMAQVLQARGFEILWCQAERASRAGILAAYDALIAGACANDAIVIYYIGHGGLMTNGAYNPEAPDLPRYIQNICPSDYALTTEDDFRAISSYELSLRLAELTRKTENVTVLLDCCYATALVRNDLAVIAPKLTRVGLTKHLQALRAASADFETLDRAGNPHAVRLSASGRTAAAYQLQLPAAAELEALGLRLPAQGWIGAMTFRLAEVLARVGTARLSWRAILADLRTRLVVQRPELAGPDLRVPFSLDTAEAGTLAVHSEGGTAIVDAGQLLGVAVGDVYGVMPGGAKTIDPATLIEELIITEVTATEARGPRTAWRAGAGELPASAVALPISLALERLPVRVVADAPARPVIDAALRASNLLRAATELDRQVVAELRVHGDQLELRDTLGPLFPPADSPGQLAAAVKDLENLATEHRLRALSDQHGPITPGVSLALVVIRDGEARVVSDHGTALGLGDRIALKLTNTGKASVHANVFNIGLRRKITRLNRAPSGVELRPAGTYYISNEVAGPLEGFALRWPIGLPRDQPRLDTILVVLTPKPADLSMLVSSEHLAATRGPRANAVTRSGAEAAPPAFALRWLDYALYPLDASLDFGPPQVDASPPGSAPPRVDAAQRRGIWLDQLTLAAGTRIDVLVCARSATTPYRATTMLGDAPSKLAIWLGELRGPADVYVWSSPVSADRRPLAELMASRDLGEPVATLRADAGDPRARLAAGASMQLAAIARTALLGVAPGAATAFHGSFGADPGEVRRYAAASVTFAVVIEPPVR
jgi:Caspase domain